MVVEDAGIYIAPGSDDNLIEGNYLGVTVGGTASGSNDFGIIVSSSGNSIGGTLAATHNLISNNNTGGIAVFPGLESKVLNSVSGNLIIGNLIGTNASGTAALGNGSDPTNGKPYGFGIGIAGASDTTIGGTTTGNVVSGNSGVGLAVTGYISDLSPIDPSSGEELTTSGTVIEGNYFGTDISGTAAVGNNAGIVLGDATDTTIGGTVGGSANVISANTWFSCSHLGFGIGIGGSLTSGVVVEGNLIGTEVGGTISLGNAGVGIGLEDPSGPDTSVVGVPSGVTIGGTTTGAENVISGNGSLGIVIEGDSAVNASENDVIPPRTASASAPSSFRAWASSETRSATTAPSGSAWHTWPRPRSGGPQPARPI
jgi:hypothetical protein